MIFVITSVLSINHNSIDYSIELLDQISWNTELKMWNIRPGKIGNILLLLIYKFYIIL